MRSAGETRKSAEAAKAAAWSSISWDTPSAQQIRPATNVGCGVDRQTTGSARWSGMHPDHTGELVVAVGARRRAHHVSALLSRPTFGQVHGSSPMETTRIAGATVSEAADVLTRAPHIEWGRGRNAGHLDLGTFRSHPTELGRPWVADATVHGHRMRRLRVTVAIFRYGNDRCGIQVRPKFRRPRSSLRLRHCLRSTHGAADRLSELVLTVDFTPPRRRADIVALA